MKMLLDRVVATNDEQVSYKDIIIYIAEVGEFCISF